ncbi:hypothetical protein ABW20_dc0104200 [Dactylellina cionopaga]|nr:hypothetical protein ABW20_dc0104200 [Dactylellina cionopaga]
MNDPGLDDGIKELTETQKQTASGKNVEGNSGGDQFLSPKYRARNTSTSRNNSSTSNSTTGSTPGEKKENSTGLRPHRTSCFWERFSHDSREDDDLNVENARKSRNGSPGEHGSTSSSSPMRENEAEPGDLEVGDEDEENSRELDDMSKKAQQDEQMPQLFFLLSTVFPLMSATLGPVANVMSICALVEPWRVYIPPIPGASSENSDKMPDPAWCLALNAISLACGFAANVILLLNLARRIKSKNLQPLTITLWYLSSFLLIALLAVYRQYLYETPREEHAWSQAFYYAIIAAALYFVIATLLVGNYIGVLTGKYARQFTLTIAQRTLMLQTMSLMVWLCLGAGVFAKLENWAYLDGIYFCDVTFLVVGLGDFTLSTNAGRALLFPYAAVGVVMIGLIVSSIRGLVLERGKRKVKRRLLEKQREDIVDGGKDGAADNAETQKEKFELMRTVQDKADQRRKWMSLCFSVSFFLLFWLVGAYVFMESEYSQSWTYFQSLYFCFTTILTIGYGDFHPNSNSGKPFFVIWSLLAVPMMTILVSNLGDTVIVMIKNLTLWLGEWTVLPEEKLNELGGKNRWLKSERRRRQQQRQQQESSQNTQEEKRRKNQDLDDQLNDPEDAEEKRQLQRIGTGLVNEEEKESKGHEHVRDSMALIHHDLAIAVQKLLPDLTAKPPKQYSFEEWSGYLKLINSPDLEPQEKSTHMNAPRMEGKNEEKKTNWLGEDSPLMSRQSETEWLLTKLCSRLEECLRKQKDNERRTNKGKQTSGRPAAGSSTGIR